MKMFYKFQLLIIEFSTIDNNLACYNENEDCEDAIVNVIKSKHQTLGEDDSDDEDPPVPVTNQEAKNLSPGYSVILCR